MMDNNMIKAETNKPSAADRVNYIYLAPEKWKKHPDVKGTVYDRFSVPCPFEEDGEMSAVLSLGNWSSTWCEITNGAMVLEKNTAYRFVFWLNGGENDRYSEVCQLHVIFTDDPVNIPMTDWENKLCFKLNRGYIKPLKHYAGWELYSIPFKTGDKDFVQMRFVAQNAPMAAMAAKAPEEYDGLPDCPDPFAGERPQRHNIIFEDGWPANYPYSTAKLMKKQQGEKEKHSREMQAGSGYDGAIKAPAEMSELLSRVIEENLRSEEFISAIAEQLCSGDFAENLAANMSIGNLADAIAGEIDTGGIADAIDMDSIADMIADRLDIDRITERVISESLKSDEFIDSIAESLCSRDFTEKLASNINMESLIGAIAREIDTDDIANALDADSIAETVAERVGADRITEKVKELIADSLSG